VREAVGYARLVGAQTYHQLHEVYRALRLVVNCFQPSLKLQAKVPKGEQVRRVYDVAQTPLQRLLASGVLSEARQRALRERVQQIDPLALSEHLDALRYALWCGAHMPPAVEASGGAWPLLGFSLAACMPVSLLTPEEGSEWTGHQETPSSSEETPALLQAHPELTSTQILQEIGRQAPSRAVSTPMETLLHDLDTTHPPLRASWEDPWPPELIQGDPSESLSMEPHLPERAVSEASQSSVLAHPLLSLPRFRRVSPGWSRGECLLFLRNVTLHDGCAPIFCAQQISTAKMIR
jgi:hypothetical protein